ncbi:hypothetical protein ABZX77_05780 [Streptomyces sp. NPDC004237]|uniref:hypothetical protein n=1 Tax=Streptomyces sp. NPDC004237 TaxID=3154455 RepID=UPI0033B52364
MTTQQMFILGAIGGLTVLLGLVVFVGVAVGLYFAFTHWSDVRAERRERRLELQANQDLQQCRAIDALGTTTHHPKDTP